MNSESIGLSTPEQVDITYVDLQHNNGIDISMSEALENTRTKMVGELVAKLPRYEETPLTAAEISNKNTKDFVNAWHDQSKKLGCSRLQFRGPQKRISFLSQDAVLGLMQDVGIVPVGADEVALEVLRNSIPANDMDTEKDMTDGGWLYDIYPAQLRGNAGFILRKYARGLF